jgi:hypothetical protein
VVALLRRKRNAVQTGRPQGAPLRDVDICRADPCGRPPSAKKRGGSKRAPTRGAPTRCRYCRGDPCGRPPSAKEKCGSNRAPTRGAPTRCRYCRGGPLWSPLLRRKRNAVQTGRPQGAPLRDVDICRGDPCGRPPFGEREMRFKQGAHKGRPYATSIFVGATLVVALLRRKRMHPQPRLVVIDSGLAQERAPE